MLVAAFPSLQPRAELEWMDRRAHGSTDELRFCRSMCTLIDAVQRDGLLGEAQCEFVVLNGRLTDSPWYVIAARATAAVQAWLLDHWRPDVEPSPTLMAWLGVVSHVLDRAPCLSKMANDMPAVASTLLAQRRALQLAVEWNRLLVGEHRAVRSGTGASTMLDAVPGTKPDIDWPRFKCVLAGILARGRGHYSVAHRYFTEARFVHQWTPSKSVADFLAAPRAEYHDAPGPFRLGEVEPPPFHRGLDPLGAGGCTFVAAHNSSPTTPPTTTTTAA